MTPLEIVLIIGLGALILVSAYFATAWYIGWPPFRKVQLVNPPPEMNPGQPLNPPPTLDPISPITGMESNLTDKYEHFDNISLIDKRASEKYLRYGKRKSKLECEDKCTRDKSCVGYSWFGNKASPSKYREECYGIDNKDNYSKVPYSNVFSGHKN